MQRPIAQAHGLRPEQYSENNPFESGIKRNSTFDGSEFKQRQIPKQSKVLNIDAQIDCLKPNGFPFQNGDDNNKHQVATLTDDHIHTNTLIQNAPIVLYVRPGVNGRPPIVKKGTNIREMELTLRKHPLNANSQLEREISLGDISGIFKNKTTKRMQSAPKEERKKRLQAQRQYADKLR